MSDKKVDPEEVAAVVHGIVASLQGDLSAADIKLFQELEGLARYIENARQEITALRTDEIRTQHIPTATDELDAIVTATEEATGTILDAAENIESIAGSLDGSPAEELGKIVTNIYEACNFQDVTGQCISKVVNTFSTRCHKTKDRTTKKL